MFGHLSLYPARWLADAGLDGSVAAAPANYAELFAAGKECLDDESGLYPPMAGIVETFKRVHTAALERLGSLPDERLREPNPREGRMREMFPTLGGLLMFYMTSHMMMHIGQISAWRRCMGLGPVM
ncbi:MAG: DinB family protein [Phycisphaerales bacterium]